MKTHVTNTVRGCFSTLRQIRSVRRSLPRHALVTLVRALVVSEVDYCNAVLVGIPGYLQKRLQSVMNAAALLIYSAKKYDHITPLLRELHWLCPGTYPVPAMRAGLPLSDWHSATVPG